jgi:hypothetical protein
MMIMIGDRTAEPGSADGIDSRATVDFFIAVLSDKDIEVRRRSVRALGAKGDPRAVEPLMFALTRELSLGAESYTVFMDVVEALERLPDRRALDLLLKIEAQLIDYGSPGCRIDLPLGAVVYHSKGARRIDRIVPREVHYKVFEGLRMISNALSDRTEIVAERFHAYQLKVMEEEVNRLMPLMSEVLAESPGEPAPADERPATGQADADIVMPEPAQDIEEAVAGDFFDRELIKRQMEAQIIDYINKNEDMLMIIQNGQRLKAGMRQARDVKGKIPTEMPVRSARAFVR